MARSPTSRGCVAVNSGTITTSPGRISCVTLRRPPGVRTCAASAMASRSTASPAWRCAAGRRWTSAATGNAPGRLDQPPADHAGGLDARDRRLRPVERAEQRSLKEVPAAIIHRRHGLAAHDPLGKLACRRRWGGFAQLVVDQPQALAGVEPGIARPRPLGTDVVRPDLRIEQPHGGIEMRQVGALLRKLLFK